MYYTAMKKLGARLQYFAEKSHHIFQKDLLVYKIFCFCIYGSFGSFYPYLALYFKQLGLGAHQSGTVIGTRTLVQCLGAPFWAAISDKFKVGRFILFGSLTAWLLKVLLILAIRPHNQYCIRFYHNDSYNGTFISVENLWEVNEGIHEWIKVPSKKIRNKTIAKSNLKPYQIKTAQKYEVIHGLYERGRKKRSGPKRKIISEFKTQLKIKNNNSDSWSNVETSRSKRLIVKRDFRLQKRSRNNGVDFELKNKLKQHSGTIGKATEMVRSNHRAITAVSEGFDNQLGAKVKYVTQVDQQEIHHIFIIFILIIIIGEFLESPTFTLSDASMVNNLRDKNENYGSVRWFGCIGAAISILLVGYLAFNSRFDLCHSMNHNYMSAFYVYSGFVSAALFTVFGFTFTYPESSTQSSTIKVAAHLFNLADMSFLMAAWFAGAFYGFLVHYVNWYIDDLRGNSVVMGAVGASREISGAFFFFLEGFIIRRTGTFLAVSCGLAAFSLSFCIYSLLGNPLLAIILQAFDGATYAIVWSSSLHYFGSVGKQLQSPAVIQGKVCGNNIITYLSCKWASMVGAVVRSLLSDRKVSSSIPALPNLNICATFFSA